MKKLSLCLTLGLASVALLVFLNARTAKSPWLTDLPKAQAQAKAENKMVFLNFTGSDW